MYPIRHICAGNNTDSDGNDYDDDNDDDNDDDDDIFNI